MTRSRLLALVLLCGSASAESPAEFSRGYFARERLIWTSPQRATTKHLLLMSGIGLGVARLMADDVKWSSGLPQNGSFQHFGRSASHVGSSYGLLALSGGIFAVGRLRGDSHLQQTGLAAGEAALHSFVLTFGLKMAATRERPNTGSGQGEFFSGFSQVRKGENSFPSGHSLAAWAVATAVSRQYPRRKYLPWLMYGMAGLVSFSRVSAQRHYVSDVVVGAGLGYLVGRMVQSRRAR